MCDSPFQLLCAIERSQQLNANEKSTTLVYLEKVASSSATKKLIKNIMRQNYFLRELILILLLLIVLNLLFEGAWLVDLFQTFWLLVYLNRMKSFLVGKCFYLIYLLFRRVERLLWAKFITLLVIFFKFWDYQWLNITHDVGNADGLLMLLRLKSLVIFMFYLRFLHDVKVLL